MGWDSNPRWSCPHASFQDWSLKPLGHPSNKRFQRFQLCCLGIGAVWSPIWSPNLPSVPVHFGAGDQRGSASGAKMPFPGPPVNRLLVPA